MKTKITPVPIMDVGISDPTIQNEIDVKFKSIIGNSAFIGGEEVNRFTLEFAQYCGGGISVGVGNGTDALTIALKSLGIGPGDEVITVPYTFIATAEAISNVGATIKFIDVNPRSFTMDPTWLEKAITPKTKAVIPVHLYGQPCDMNPIMEITRKKRIHVIEDAAQAHGAEYKGARVGTIGDLGCFSFYPTKNLGGFGDGGAVVTRSEQFAQKVKLFANHGRSKHTQHEIVGVNSRLDALQAAVLRIKLKHLDAANDRRRWVAEQYNKVLTKQSFIEAPEIQSYAKHVFHLYMAKTSFREELLQFLKDESVGCGVYYPVPVHLQPAYSFMGHKKGDFPITESLSDQLLALPMHPNLSDEQVHTVCDALARFSPKKVK